MFYTPFKKKKKKKDGKFNKVKMENEKKMHQN